MKKLIIIATLMLMLSAFFAVTVIASGLEIDSVEIEIDGRRVLSTSSDNSHLDVKPGDELRIKINLENTFDEDTENDIKDVKVYSFIDEIDDGDDINDDSERILVRADNERSVRLRLTIPDDASSFQDYDLVIRAVGEDQNGVEYTDRITIDVEVEREAHELVFDRMSVSDAACGDDVTFRVEITNAGEEEEEDVELTVKQPGIGILFSDRFDLYGIDEYDHTYTKTRVLDVSGLPDGRHTLYVTLYYDSGRKLINREISFSKDDCGRISGKTVQESYGEDIESPVEQYNNPKRDTTFLFRDGPEVVVQMPPPGIPVPTPPKATVPRESDFSIMVLVLANIALIVFVVLLLISVYQQLKK
ncbi:MAG: hypothetical protein V1729_03080 [Candidatus Woesearchaeota archaeon]